MSSIGRHFNVFRMPVKLRMKGFSLQLYRKDFKRNIGYSSRNKTTKVVPIIAQKHYVFMKHRVEITIYDAYKYLIFISGNNYPLRIKYSYDNIVAIL